jgi:hypothetical protein
MILMHTLGILPSLFSKNLEIFAVRAHLLCYLDFFLDLAIALLEHGNFFIYFLQIDVWIQF